MKFTPPPLKTPETPKAEVPKIRFLAAYNSTVQWEAWVGPVAAPRFIGAINKFGKQDWRSVTFPKKKFKSRIKAAEFLL